MDEILIRKLREEDADAIIQIEAAITPAQDGLDLKRIVEDQVHRKGDASYVAVMGDRVVGYMISYITSGNFGVNKCAWISVLGVDPKYMDRGIGKELGERIFQHYKALGVKEIFTTVRWDHTDLLSFFKTLGFDRSSFIHLRKGLD